MSENKRLTVRDMFGNADIIELATEKLYAELSFHETNLLTKALNRLAAFEDKIENGTLIELPCVAYNVKECRYQIISAKNGRVYVSKFYRDRKEAEARLKDSQEKQK